jgi:hypothetical protein
VEKPPPPPPAHPQLFKTAEDAVPPGRVGVQLGFFPEQVQRLRIELRQRIYPLESTGNSASAHPHPHPRVFKAAKDAAPPDRGAVVQLGFGSEGTENTNGTRGDHGCGLSGAQATAQKAVFNQANHLDVDTATTIKIPIKIIALSFAFVFRPPPFAHAPCPHPTRPNHSPVPPRRHCLRE